MTRPRLRRRRRCLHCGTRFDRATGHLELVGTRRVYCSDRCLRAAWRAFCRPVDEAAIL